MQLHEIGGQIGAGGGGIRIQTGRLLKVSVGFLFPALRRIHHAKEFMNVKAFGELLHQSLESCRRLCQAVGIVQLDCFLKLALQLLFRFNVCAQSGR